MQEIWVGWLLLASYFDFRERRVPNWLVILGLTFAALALLTERQPFELAWAHAIISSIFAFLFFLIFYTSKVMGAGDVKFAGVLALWVGLIPFAAIWLMASVFAGIHALLYLLSKKRTLPFLLEKFIYSPTTNETSELSKSKQIPYAAYLALSAIAWFFIFKQTPSSQ